MPALPAAGSELGASTGAIQLAISLYLLGVALGQLIGGWGSDLLGRRPIILGGTALYILGAASGALAPALPVLLAARLVQGFGGACLLAVSRTMTVDLARDDDATRTLAMLGMISLLSPALSPLIGGLIVEGAGWRTLLGLLTVLGMIAFVAAWRGVTETRATAQGGPQSPFSGFARLLRRSEFWRYTLAGAATTTGLFGFLAASPFVLVEIYGLRVRETGFVYLALAGSVGLGGLIATRLRRGSLMIGSVAYAIGAALLLFSVMFLPGLAALVIPMLIVGTASGMITPAALAGALQVDRDHVGTASSLVGALQIGAAAATTTLFAAFVQGPLGAVLPMAGAALILQLLLFGRRRQSAQ